MQTVTRCETNASTESKEYLSEQIITYIGNKRSLLPFIDAGVQKVREDLGKDKIDILDLFSGTGIVSRSLKQYAGILYANDLELYSKITNECYLANKPEIDIDELQTYHAQLTDSIYRNWTRGFISEMYAPLDDANIQAGERVFFTRRNAEYIDTARQEIERLPKHIQSYFLAPLLSQASIHVNTAGVFKGFYKDKNGIGCFGGSGKNALSRITRDMVVQLPVFSNFDCSWKVLCGDAGTVVKEIPRVDLAYIDPPYNQHPYGSNYFMLNLIASYSKPMRVSSVSGIPETWKRSHYNKRHSAQETLFSTVENCKASHILISYNSEGFISYDSFVGFLERIGEVEVLETDYNTFRGCRNLRDRDTHVKEYLFLLKKRNPRSGV